MNVFHKTVVAILSGVIMTIILLFTSDIPNKSNNGFDRYFLTIKPVVESKVNLRFPSREIIHMDTQEILISTNSSNIILSHVLSSSQVEQRYLEINPTLRKQIGNIYSFDYDEKNCKTTLFANNLHGMLTLVERSSDFIKLGDGAFYYAVTISSNSYILRRFEEKTNDAIFERITIPSNIKLKEQNISLRSTDGGLSTDGLLLFNKENGLLNYMHYYNNEILSFDTTLKLVKRFQTIDTISHKEQLDRNKPLFVTNKKSFVYGDYIFICSNLKADNETMRDYMKNLPIDIYNVKTGTYKGSIYVPAFNRQLIASIKYDGKKLAALYYDNHLVLFELPIQDFKF